MRIFKSVSAMDIQKRVAGTSYPISTTAPPQPVPMPEKYGIKTQQGFSQHVLWLSQQDAKIYTELLTRNNIWWVDVTNGG
jgi:hypothetical protein